MLSCCLIAPSGAATVLQRLLTDGHLSYMCLLTCCTCLQCPVLQWRSVLSLLPFQRMRPKCVRLLILFVIKHPSLPPHACCFISRPATLSILFGRLVYTFYLCRCFQAPLPGSPDESIGQSDVFKFDLYHLRTVCVWSAFVLPFVH